MPPPSRDEGVIDTRSVVYPKDLTARLKALLPERQRQIHELKESTEHDHDRLVRLGGRPTRWVRDEPAWKASDEDGFVILTNPDSGHETTLPADEELVIYHHWKDESFRAQEELRSWESFQCYQSSKNHPPLLSSPIAIYAAPTHLRYHLEQLHVWQEYEAWQTLKVNHDNDEKEDCLLELTILNMEKASQGLSDEEWGSVLGQYLHKCKNRRDDLSKSRKRLAWISAQYCEIMDEILGDLPVRNDDPTVEFEDKLWDQTSWTSWILDRVGIPTNNGFHRPSEGTEDWVEKCCKFISETSRLGEIEREWKQFLQWRGRLPKDAATADAIGLEQLMDSHELDTLSDYLRYRREKLARAEQQAKSWCKLHEWQDFMTKPLTQQVNESNFRMHYSAEVKENAIASSDQAAEARMKYEQAERYLSDACARWKAANDPEPSLQAVYGLRHSLDSSSISLDPPQEGSQSETQTQKSCRPIGSLSVKHRNLVRLKLEKEGMRRTRGANGLLEAKNDNKVKKSTKTKKSKQLKKKPGNFTERFIEELTAIIQPPPSANAGSEYLGTSSDPANLLSTKHKDRRLGKSMAGTKETKGSPQISKITKASKTKGKEQLEHGDTKGGPQVSKITKPSKTKGKKQLEQKFKKFTEGQVQVLIAVAVPPASVDTRFYKSKAEENITKRQTLTPSTRKTDRQQQQLKVNQGSQAVAAKTPPRKSKRLRGEDSKIG